MKIITFNTQHCLNYLEQKIDFEIMANTIKSIDADIVGLNEMRDEGEAADYQAQTRILSELTGMEHFFFAKAIDVEGNNPYGNAFLSKIPIKSAEVVPIPDPEVKGDGDWYETRCILKAVLENDVVVLVTHFGLYPDEQQLAIDTVLKTLEDKKCILMGDFNVKPDDRLLLPIRQRMIDAADAIGEEKLSFPSDEPNRKIDYIFVTPDIKVVSADIPAIVASDHRPHIAEVDIQG